MDEIIKQAQKIVADLKDRDGKIRLNTTKLRKFLTAVNAINNKLEAYQSQTGAGNELKELPKPLADEIRYLEVKLAYESGREKDVKDFVTKAKLIDRIRAIGTSADKYRDFAKLIEAIVAFHKYESAMSSEGGRR
ncbi:CRISPR-associated protein, Csm2 family [Thermosinus carboxydivorans Nor1]|uniref:CRISPR system Cms protein Csm2 n=1 Tax=Thermosinus carboxydivorans Nor1 TaxID=401526 RepID=A1HM63_9FIRM|nr:type III-A CRISPR-associated protein Csm2 [Thermosinus carboxydivorans]EAX48912.1 CRISPR-associated protein, Csm2 family [Thermosinus carboxydivorans Nor1]